jgi:XTP/dITP diphosphohydrolase
VNRVYCATSNQGKLREFRVLARGLDIEPLPELASIVAPEETGTTFAENAILKAEYYGRYAPGMLFAEDSGIEVDALSGAPGVFSARFAGEGASDEDNNRLLLERMLQVADRRAKYVSVIALADCGKLVQTFRGEVEGRILTAPKGVNGFGYDPLFLYEPRGLTFGEMPAEEKTTITHRARAFAKLLEYVGQA